MGTIDPRDAIPLTDEGKRLQEEYRQRMKETLAEIPIFDMEQTRKDIIRIHSDAIHQMGGDPVQRNYVDALTERLVAAEQRANDAEARAERLAKYLSGFDVTEDGEVRDEDGEPYEDTFIVNMGMQAAGIKEIHAALTAPATQPDERAAAARALIDDFGEDGSLTWVHPWYVLPDYDSGNGLEIAFCHPKDDARGRMLTAFVPLSALRCFTTDAAKEGTTEETTFERGYRWLVDATDGAAKEEM